MANEKFIDDIDVENILTVSEGDIIETKKDIDNTNWHEIRNASITKKILSSVISGSERTEAGYSVGIVFYKGFRIVIPANEIIELKENDRYGETKDRESRILDNLIGAEIDFIIKGIDDTTRSIVASRKEAMARKSKMFFIDKSSNDEPKVIANKVVQARVVAVSKKSVRFEIFGVETSLFARDLSHGYLLDATDKFTVGEKVLVRIDEINIDDEQNVKISIDIKCLEKNEDLENLKLCKVQGKYAGVITEIAKGVVFIRLHTGVNAIAHSCADKKHPGKNDEISFVVTHIDNERGVAVGLITKILKQNI